MNPGRLGVALREVVLPWLSEQALSGPARALPAVATAPHCPPSLGLSPTCPSRTNSKVTKPLAI